MRGEYCRQRGGTTIGPVEYINCFFLDSKGGSWLATNGGGVYHCEDVRVKHYTTKNGLCSDYVLNIQQDVNGAIWFTTRDGVCMLGGTRFGEKYAEPDF